MAPYAEVVSSLFLLLGVTGFLGNIWVVFTVVGQLNRRRCRGRTVILNATAAAAREGGGCADAAATREAVDDASAMQLRRHRKSVVRSQQSSAFIYLLTLSAVDLCSVFVTPLIATDVMYQRWMFGNLTCKLMFACEGMNKFLSPLILTALSIDRYFAICKPRRFHLRSTFAAGVAVSICCMIALVFIAPLLYYSDVKDLYPSGACGEPTPKCMFEFPPHLTKYYHIGQFVEGYLTPLVLICLVYALIVIRLYKHTRYSSVGRATTISLGRVVKCTLMLVVFYFVCWTPYWGSMVVSQLISFGDYDTVSTIVNSTSMTTTATAVTRNASNGSSGCPRADMMILDDWMVLLMYISHSLPYAQSAFNWLFYAFLNRQLRQTLREAGSRNNLGGGGFLSGDYSHITNAIVSNLSELRGRVRAELSPEHSSTRRRLRRLMRRCRSGPPDIRTVNGFLYERTTGATCTSVSGQSRLSSSSESARTMSTPYRKRGRSKDMGSSIGSTATTTSRYLTVGYVNNVQAQLLRQQQHETNRAIADELCAISIGKAIGRGSKQNGTVPDDPQWRPPSDAITVHPEVVKMANGSAKTSRTSDKDKIRRTVSTGAQSYRRAHRKTGKPKNKKHRVDVSRQNGNYRNKRNGDVSSEESSAVWL